MFTTELEQEFELTKLETITIPRMTNRQITEELISTIKLLMMTKNQFSKRNELTLAQQFELHRMQNCNLERKDAIAMLLIAKKQLMIKLNVLKQFRKEVGWI